MRVPPSGRGFASRPGAAERWIRSNTSTGPITADMFSARLTIDVTPAMRQRLKLAAVMQGTTVAGLIRTLIDQHFPDTAKDPT